MSLSTPQVSASPNTTPPLPQKKPIDSNLSDIVKVALPVIAMLAGFVFLPLEGAILFTGVIMIGGYIYNDCYDRKPLDKTAPLQPSTPAKTESAVSKAPSSEPIKKKLKTKTQRQVSATPPAKASQFGRLAMRHFKSESSDDEPTLHITVTPAQPAAPKTPLLKSPAQLKTPTPQKTPFCKRFGDGPTEITFTRIEEPSTAPPVDLPKSTPVRAETPLLLPASPFMRFSPQRQTEPPFIEPKVEKPRLSLSKLFSQDLSEPEDLENQSPSSKEASQPVSDTPLNTSRPPRHTPHPKSNKTTALRGEAIASKYGRTPNSRKHSSKITPHTSARDSSASETELTEVRKIPPTTASKFNMSPAKLARSARASSGSDSETPAAPTVTTPATGSRLSRFWNSSTNPRSKKKVNDE